MRVQQLLEHHGIAVNPFAEEDAQTDPVFKERCRDATYHPAWDKVYGDPSDPATSIVFGEKGSGKTAMRMQMAGRIALLQRAARQQPAVRHRVRRLQSVPRPLRRPAQRPQAARPGHACWPSGSCGTTWTRSCRWASRAWSIGCSACRSPAAPPPTRSAPTGCASLDRHQKRDLLLLAACYDNSHARNVVVALEPAAPQDAATAPGKAGGTKLLGIAVTLAVVARHHLLAAMGLARHALAVR